jgi:hypothetical protein
LPFNVYDRNKKYLGFIQSAYPKYTNVFMVASTDVKLGDEDFHINNIKSELAGYLGCKNILGKINEPRLSKSIDNIIIKEFGKFKDNTYDELLKLIYLRVLRYEEKFYFKNIKNEQINAYFLVDVSNVVIENNSIIMDEEIDYINTEKLENNVPMVAKIMDYPRIQIDSMSSGQGLLLGADLADLAGRNHVHKTKLKKNQGILLMSLIYP